MTDVSGSMGAGPPGWAPPPPQAWGPAAPAPLRRTRPPRQPDAAPRRLLLLCLGAGAALEMGGRGGLANALVALGAALVILGLVTDRRLRRRPARVLAATALLPLAFLAVRASPWLVASNVAAAGLLVTAALAFSRSGSVADTTLGRFARRAVATVPSAWSAPRSIAPLLPSVSDAGTKRAGRVALAALVCVPVLAVVVGLLASADPVFAGLLTPDLDAGPAAGHLLMAVVLALAALCVIGAAGADTTDGAPHGRFGPLEVATMLLLTALVLGLFVIAQLVAVTSAGDRLVARAGLTPAEYARSGFFQLCWATGLIVSLLAVIRSLAAPDVLRAPVVRALGALVPCLALGLVVVSLRRMALYDDAFGLTMLRLWVMGAAVWMGAVLMLVAVRNAGVGARRDWVLAAASVVAIGLVLAADVANPEARVAQHNLDRARAGAELDVDYLAQLSDDALPTIAAAVADTEEGLTTTDPLAEALRCGDESTGATALNLSVQRADDVRRHACADVLAG